MYENDEPEVKDTTSNLYRITPDVRKEIEQALTEHGVALSANKVLVTRAFLSLKNPVNINVPADAPQPVQESAPSVTLQHSDAIREAVWKNGIEVLKRTISLEINKTENTETRDALRRVLSKVTDVI